MNNRATSLSMIRDCVEVIKEKGNEGNHPYLEIGDVDVESKEYTFSEKRAVKGCRRARNGDILISRVRPTRGAIALIREDEVEVSSAFSVLRALPHVDQRYLWHCLAWNELYLQHLGEHCTGTMYPTTSDEDVVDFAIPIPPPEVQRWIARKLDLASKKVREVKRRLNFVPAQIKRYRTAVLQKAFSGCLTGRNSSRRSGSELTNSLDGWEVPDGWRVITIGELAKCSRGRFSVRPRNDPSCYGGPYPFIQIGDLPKDGGFVTSHRQTLNDRGRFVSKSFPNGTVAIAIVGATIGNTGVLGYDMYFPDSMIGIDSGDYATNRYIELWLRLRKEHIRSVSYAGGGQPNIKMETITQYGIPVAPTDELTKIVERVDELFDAADDISNRLLKVRALVEKIMSSMLRKAFRGELLLDHAANAGTITVKQAEAGYAKIREAGRRLP